VFKNERPREHHIYQSMVQYQAACVRFVVIFLPFFEFCINCFICTVETPLQMNQNDTYPLW
jgi:hypothetical protein